MSRQLITYKPEFGVQKKPDQLSCRLCNIKAVSTNPTNTMKSLFIKKP